MSDKPYVTMTILLTRPVTGQEIMDAVRQTDSPTHEKSEYVQKVRRIVDDMTYYAVGRTSMWPTMHLAMLVGNGVIDADDGIATDMEYTNLAVTHCNWGGDVYAAIYHDDDVSEAVRRYRDELMKLLPTS